MTRQVIEVIERPLVEALETYYSDKMCEEVTEKYGEGLSDEDLKLLTDSLKEDGRVFEDVYFEETELKRLLGVVGVETGESTGEPGVPDISTMVKTRIWKNAGYKIQSIGTTESFLAWMKVGIITG